MRAAVEDELEKQRNLIKATYAPMLEAQYSPCPVILLNGRVCHGTIDTDWSESVQHCTSCGQTWNLRGRPLKSAIRL